MLSAAAEVMHRRKEQILPRRGLLLQPPHLVHELHEGHRVDGRRRVVHVRVGDHLLQLLPVLLVLGRGLVQLRGGARVGLVKAVASSKAASTAAQIFGLASTNFLETTSVPLVCLPPTTS